jgi:hypothetical protein
MYFDKRLETTKEVTAFLNSNPDIEIVSICLYCTNYTDHYIVFYKSEVEKK